ncbi:30S ribosomal protein S18 [Candidatus Collierbacteria bacterium]|nr:30S ribosomal protein S18 [Candidatus Collierbacteria bacterium]
MKKVNKPCVFCVKKEDPDYKKVDTLQISLSNKGRIVSRFATGLCLKHQRRMAVAIKRARHIALIAFV